MEKISVLPDLNNSNLELVIPRYDYILIWGNGMPCKYEILKMIENHKDFEILKIIEYEAKDIAELVEAVYSYDYAPIEHLRAKIEYLYSTSPKVLFIFFKNNNPNEDYLSEDAFRHIESLTVKKFKEELRNKFNERKEDRRSENHVIHASDNQKQTDYILKYIGYKNGLKDLLKTSNRIINAPEHLADFKKISIKKVPVNDLYANILINDKPVCSKTVPVGETPHYKTLKNNADDYANYIKAFQGSFLQDFYSINKLNKLAQELDYPHNSNYICVKLIENKYVIMDGVHRAAVLMKKGEKDIIVAEVL